MKIRNIFSHCLLFLYITHVHMYKNLNSLRFLKNYPVEAVVTLLEKCFISHTGGTVLFGDWTNEDFIALHRNQSFTLSFVLIGVSEIKLKWQIRDIRLKLGMNIPFLKVYPAQNFILVLQDVSECDVALTVLKQSLYWNHKGFFIVVNKTDKHCKFAFTILSKLWSYNILNGIILCGQSEDQLRIYTLNPYNQFAPSFWTIANQSYNAGHVWTMFRHISKQHLLSQINSSWCSNLNFDKTRALNGYTINAGGSYSGKVELINKSNLKSNNTDDFDYGYMKPTLDVILKHLNATLKLQMYDEMCLFDKHKNICSIFDHLIMGKLDLFVHPLFPQSFWNHYTRPLFMSGLCLITKVSRNPPKNSFFYPDILFTSIFINAILMVTLTYILESDIAVSYSESLLMILSMPNVRQPQGFIKRLIFILFNLSMFIYNAYIQSRLSALHTAPDSLPEINTLEELEHSQFFVHGRIEFREYFRDSIVSNHYVPIDNEHKCLKFNLNKTNACIFPCSKKDWILRENIHLSKNKMKELGELLYVRKSWPLVSKINSMLKKLCESGLINFFYRSYPSFTKPSTKQLLQEIKTFNLTLNDVMLAPYTLVFGLIFASFVFFVEMIITRLPESIYVVTSKWKKRLFQLK